MKRKIKLKTEIANIINLNLPDKTKVELIFERIYEIIEKIISKEA